MTSATKQLPQRQPNPPKLSHPKLPTIDARSSNLPAGLSAYTPSLLGCQCRRPFLGSSERCWIARKPASQHRLDRALWQAAAMPRNPVKDVRYTVKILLI